MVKKTHVQGGLIISLLTAPILIGKTINVSNGIECAILLATYVGGAGAGALLPDIDLKNSYISRKAPILHKLYGKRFKHRGFTHSLLALMAMCIWCDVVSKLTNMNTVINALLTGAFMGCVSHIILDLFTVEGVNLFSPINKTIHFAKIKTGSKKEKKLNRNLEFAIYVLLGINVYMVIHNIGINFIEVLSSISIQIG